VALGAIWRIVAVFGYAAIWLAAAGIGGDLGMDLDPTVATSTFTLARQPARAGMASAVARASSGGKAAWLP
jgi:hypothetical protein